MPLFFQDVPTFSEITANPDTLYLYEDNEKRVGMKPFLNTPNVLGIRVMKTPSTDSKHAFWNDQEFDQNTGIIDEDLAKVEILLKQGRIVVFPLKGLGTDRAKLDTLAPKTYTYLCERVARLLRIFNKKGPVDAQI